MSISLNYLNASFQRMLINCGGLNYRLSGRGSLFQVLALLTVKEDIMSKSAQIYEAIQWCLRHKLSQPERRSMPSSGMYIGRDDDDDDDGYLV